MSSLFDKAKANINEAVETAAPEFQPGSSNCQSECSPNQPMDAPNPFRPDGLMQIYCWGLVHGPKVSQPEAIQRPANSPHRWTQEVNRTHWENGIMWTYQAIRCITRSQLVAGVGVPLLDLIKQIQSEPKANRMSILERHSGSGAAIGAMRPMPMLQANKLTRIAEYKLSAVQRNIWPSQQAFWQGAKAAAQHYAFAWQSQASPVRPNDPMTEWYAEGLYDALFLEGRRLA